MPSLFETPAVAPRFAGRHWFGEPARAITAPLGRIVPRIPTFDRLPFGVNPRLDMIVRRATRSGDIPLPVATVSKSYVLVQHLALVKALVQALRTVHANPLELPARLTITKSGSRMALRVVLPEAFTWIPPDRHPMALTFECLNSVDRTVPLGAAMAWHRLVCRNGLAIRQTDERTQQHRPSLQIDDVERLLVDGVARAAADHDVLAAAAARGVSGEAIRTWVDGPVAAAWGPFAAARIYSIATLGRDGEPARIPRSARPHARKLTKSVPVPGSPVPCQDAYGLAQALSWVASRRHDVAERIAWRNQIGELVAQVA